MSKLSSRVGIIDHRNTSGSQGKCEQFEFGRLTKQLPLRDVQGEMYDPSANVRQVKIADSTYFDEGHLWANLKARDATSQAEPT